MTVLVAYASAHGSTRQIADRVAVRLAEQDGPVECLPVARVDDLDRYRAVVVGSAVHDQQWLPEAVAFLRDHTAELRSRPVWLFSVGMPGALPAVLRRWAQTEAPQVAASLPDVQPLDAPLFTGVVRPDHLSTRGRLLFRLLGGRYGDFRDWAAVDGWAQQVAGALVGVAHRG